MNLHHGGDFYYVILSFSFFAERALACRYDLVSVLSRCSFHMARVCVCLYGFASALSHSLFVGRGSVCTWLALRPCKALGHTRLRHPCLFMNALLALRPCKAFGRSFQASLPCLPLPLHQTFPPLQPSQKDNNPSLSTMPLPDFQKI